VLPFRSNIPKLSEFVFWQIDETYPRRAVACKDFDGHAVIGGNNYGQGSSREHAAIVPRYLGLRAVIAKSFARIHWQNLANFGILPLEFENGADHDEIDVGDVLALRGLRSALRGDDRRVELSNETKGKVYGVRHRLSSRQADMVLTGGLIPVFKKRLAGQTLDASS
jgi:aconitate hydratase